MRILVVQNLYPPHALGGYEDLCAGTVRAWREAGHHVVVLTSDWRRADVTTDEPPGGEPVVRDLPIHWDDHVVQVPGWRARHDAVRRTRAVLGRVLDEHRPDVVSVWNAAALSFAAFDVLAVRQVPTVLVLGDRWLGFGLALDPWHGWFARGLGRRLASAVARATGTPTTVRGLGDPVVACFGSRHLRDHGVRVCPWPLDDVAVVPHGIDLDRHPVTGLGRPPWRGRLLFVGRVVATKGLETAVRALTRLPDEITLDVVGPPAPGHAEELEALAATLGVADRVHLHGGTDAAGVRAAYGDADVLLFPSAWQEPVGMVPLEAMAHGLPVVATGTGGSGEFLVDGRTALLHAPGDPAALAAAVATLADDPSLRARLVDAGRQVATWLDRRRTATELLTWHAWVAGGTSGPRPPERGLLPPELTA